MNSPHIFFDLALLALSALVVGYLIYRLIKRGISQKYQRPAKKAASNPWSALSQGEDPTIDKTK